jgi:flagellar motility protein MotE (MotC chaperone)
VKFILVPLLIIGMFVSFGAALVAMLFFTQTVKSPEELVGFVLGDHDSTAMFDEFHLKEDRLQEMSALMEEYRVSTEEMNQQAVALQESLAAKSIKLQALDEKLQSEREVLDGRKDTAATRASKESLKELSKFYDKIKPQSAAEILQEGTLSDTTVATLMGMLQPQQMAKIMGNMNPDFAAGITKIMKELPR